VDTHTAIPSPAGRTALRWLTGVSLAGLATAVAAAFVVLHEPARHSAGLPGELVYERGTVTWRLQQGQCRHEDLVEALVGEGKVGEHKAALIQQGERKWIGCWAMDYEADVLLVDVTGVRGFMPREWFRAV
jgi:hypothetical protein